MIATLQQSISSSYLTTYHKLSILSKTYGSHIAPTLQTYRLNLFDGEFHTSACIKSYVPPSYHWMRTGYGSNTFDHNIRRHINFWILQYQFHDTYPFTKLLQNSVLHISLHQNHINALVQDFSISSAKLDILRYCSLAQSHQYMPWGKCFSEALITKKSPWLMRNFHVKIMAVNKDFQTCHLIG